MSALPAMKFSPACAGAAFKSRNTTRSTRLRQGSFVLAVAVALAVTACTGGAGLDIPVGPVDHSCHGNPDRGVLGSGCDRHR
jgi:hypothetical protein